MARWERVVKTDVERLEEFLLQQFPGTGVSISKDGNNKLTFLEVPAVADSGAMDVLVQELQKKFPLAFDLAATAIVSTSAVSEASAVVENP